MNDQGATDKEKLYAERLNRYVTAMRNEKPDQVPIRPFVAEVTGVMPGTRANRLLMTTSTP